MAVPVINYSGQSYEVVLYYLYADLEADNIESVIASQQELCEKLELLGRVRISEEGINGTLGGRMNAIQCYIDSMKVMGPLSGLDVDWKRSPANDLPFEDLQIRRVREIVSIELPYDQCHVSNAGEHIAPQDFHEMLQMQEDVAVIDVRNDYEYK